MEHVKTFKSKRRLGPIKRRREPTSAKELSALVDAPVHPTVTEIDGDGMDTRCVNDAKGFMTRRRKRAWSATMPKLDTKANTLKCNDGEKMTIPHLRYSLLNGNLNKNIRRRTSIR